MPSAPTHDILFAETKHKTQIVVSLSVQQSPTDLSKFFPDVTVSGKAWYNDKCISFGARWA